MSIMGKGDTPGFCPSPVRFYIILHNEDTLKERYLMVSVRFTRKVPADWHPFS